MTIYTTHEWKGFGKHNFYWYEYRLEGTTVTKYKCNRYKFFDGKENTWCKEESVVESWSVNDSNMPEWLRQHLHATTMVRFLTILRRIFLAGTVSLIICIFFLQFKLFNNISLLSSNNGAEITKGIICIVFLLSPFLYGLFMFFTVLNNNRKNVYSVDTSTTIINVFKCFLRDITSPFFTTKTFVISLFSKQTKTHGLIVIRFIEMIILIAICVFGVLFVI